MPTGRNIPPDGEGDRRQMIDRWLDADPDSWDKTRSWPFDTCLVGDLRARLIKVCGYTGPVMK